MVQTSTTGQLENASREMIAMARFTEEHNNPSINLIENFPLEPGSDTLVIPKVAQMTMRDLQEGQEISDEEDIGMTTISVQTNEVGGKVVITYKLLRQNTNNIFSMVGRQLGEAMSRKKEQDIQTLFASLNGGVDLGAAGRQLSAQNASRMIATAKSAKFGGSLRFIHHPTAIMVLNSNLNTIGATATAPTNVELSSGFSVSRLQNFFTGVRIGGVPFFESGEIDQDGAGDGVGVIMDKGALGILTSVAMRRERERKAVLRGWIVVLTADYSAFEIDDTRGAPVTMNVADIATT